MDSFSLKGKVAIITGGASGIGLATAKIFIESGVLGLCLVDITESTLSSALSTFTPEEQQRIITVQGDVSSESDTIRYVEETVKKFGKLDISVQNAGVSQKKAEIKDMVLEDFERVHKINVVGPFLGMKHSVRAMLASPSEGKGCAIVLTSSQLGLDGKPFISAYTSSKFAVRGLGLTAAAELGTSGIRVNTVCPGATHTPMASGVSDAQVKVLSDAAMLGRMGEAHEIAKAILYLSSDASTFVTGTTLKVDGGYSRWG